MKRMLVFDADKRITASEIQKEIESMVSRGLVLIPFAENDEGEVFIRPPISLEAEAQPNSDLTESSDSDFILPTLLEYEMEKLLFVLGTVFSSLPAELQLSNPHVVTQILRNFAKCQLWKFREIFRLKTPTHKRLEREWEAFVKMKKNEEYFAKLTNILEERFGTRGRINSR